MVANISINKMDIMIDGERKSAIQLGTVMTDPDYRNRGLSASLMNTILSEYEKNVDLIYLFANKNVLDYYPKFGFKPHNESKFSAEVHIAQSSFSVDLVRLDVLNSYDLSMINKLANERAPLSSRFGVDHAEHILKWYSLNVFNNDIYYLEEEGVIVLFQRENEKLHLYDLISRGKVLFKPIIKKIATNQVKEVIFHFTPEFEDIEASTSSFEPDEILFVKSTSVILPTNFKFPITAQA